MATVESIHSKLILDTSNFTKSLRDAFSGANSYSNNFANQGGKTVKGTFENINNTIKETKLSTEKLNTSFKQIDTTQAKGALEIFRDIGLAIGAGALLNNVISLGATFEATMSKVRAATKASKEDLTLMEQEARRLGSTTAFSASQAAEAMVELGKAGLNTSQIMKATGDTLNLAAAGELSLAEAATIAADTMSQMGLEADQVGRIGDVMSKAANSSTISVKDLSETFKYAAGVAASAKISLEELAGATAILGSAGIKASAAGTGLRSIISRLAAPSKEAAQLMKQLNVQVSDANGNFRPFSEIIGDLGQSLEGFGDVKKADIISTIFGQESTTSVLALLKAGKTGIDDMTDSMKNSSGYAKEFGDQLNDNFAGSVKNMNSALEETKLMLWEQIAPALTALVKGFTSVVSSIIEFSKENPALSKTIIQVSTAIGVLVAGILGYTGLVGAINAVGLGVMATNAKVLLFGTTLQRQAMFAGARWAVILGPFAALAGVTALTLTLTYNIIENVRRQEQAQIQQGDRSRAFSEMGALAAARQRLGSDTLKQSLQGISASLANVGNDINVINANATNLKALGFEKLAESVKNNSFQTSVSRREIAAYIRALNELDANMNRPAQTANTLSRSMSGVGASARGANQEINDVITTGKLLENQFDSEVRLKASVEIENIEKSKEEVDKLREKYKELGYEFKEIGFTAKGNTQSLQFEIIGKDTQSINKTDNLLRSIKNETKQIKYESAELAKQKVFDKTYPNEYNDALISVSKTISDIKESSSFTGKIIAGLESAKQSVQSLGNQFNKLMQAQAQLANVKFTNFKQNLDFLTAGIDKMISVQSEAQLTAIDSEIQAINNKNKQIEDMERQHQENLLSIIEEYTRVRSEELDKEFNQNVERINAEFKIKLDSLLANTSSQQEQAAITESVENDRINSINTLKEQFDQKLKNDTENKRKEEQAKLDSDKETNKKNGIDDLIRLQQLEAQKEKVTRKTELEKQRVKKVSALIEWQAGKAAFEANKRAQVAQAQIAMTMTILNGIQAWAMLTAQTGVLGLVSGGIFLGAITGLALAAGATSIAAAQSQQYPPPPLFLNSGGIVGGVGNTDSVPAMLTPGEMVVDKQTTNALKENVNNLGTTNLYLTNNITSNNPEEIAGQISEILFSRIERRFQNV